MFVCNRGDTIQYHGTTPDKEVWPSSYATGVPRQALSSQNWPAHKNTENQGKTLLAVSTTSRASFAAYKKNQGIMVVSAFNK